jgi:hypothetical protein
MSLANLAESYNCWSLNCARAPEQGICFQAQLRARIVVRNGLERFDGNCEVKPPTEEFDAHSGV